MFISQPATSIISSTTPTVFGSSPSAETVVSYLSLGSCVAAVSEKSKVVKSKSVFIK